MNRNKLIRLLALILVLSGMRIHAQFIPVKDPAFAAALCGSVKFASVMSGDCLSLDTNIAKTFTGTMQLQGLSINEVPELIYFTGINFIQLTNNNIDSIPDLTRLTNLTAVDFRGNPWTNVHQLDPVKLQLDKIEFRLTGNESVSDFSYLNQYPNLTSIFIRDFEATKMPDFSLFSGVTLVNVGLNKLSYTDLLPILNLPGSPALTLMPQRNLTNDTNIVLEEGSQYELIIPIDVGVPGITYHFFKDSVSIQNGSSNKYVIPTVTAEDAGSYHALIISDNPFFTGTNLNTSHYYITTKCSKCDDLFTPNDDGIGDLFFIEGSGTAQIRDKQGRMIKEVSLPHYWNGTDQNGNHAPIGIYIITLPDHKNKKVTILR